MLKRFSPEQIEKQTEFVEKLQSDLKFVDIDGETFNAEVLGIGGFAISIRIDVNNRPYVLKVYLMQSDRVPHQIDRELLAHSQARLRTGANYASTFVDMMFEVNCLDGYTLKLNTIPFTRDYIKPYLVATAQSLDIGESLDSWAPENMESIIKVFRSYANSLTIFRDNGIADLDRNPFNVFVQPDGRVTHIDFGMTSVVNFNVATVFRIIREKGLFNSPKERYVFLAEVMSDLAQARSDFDLPDYEMNLTKLRVHSGILLLMLTGSTIPKSSEEITRLTDTSEEKTINTNLHKFDTYLEVLLPEDIQPKVNILMSAFSFNPHITQAFVGHANINWSQILGEDQSKLVDGIFLEEGDLFGHSKAPCPATLFGKVNPTDFEKVAVCATYQMMWTLFTKLAPGLLPLDMKCHEEIHNGNPAMAFLAQGDKAGKFTMVTLFDFGNATMSNPKSVLYGVDAEIITSIYSHLMGFFNNFHATEVFGSGNYRDEYRMAGKLIDDLASILKPAEV